MSVLLANKASFHEKKHSTTAFILFQLMEDRMHRHQEILLTV
jgi:hypothetical protein